MGLGTDGEGHKSGSREIKGFLKVSKQFEVPRTSLFRIARSVVQEEKKLSLLLLGANQYYLLEMEAMFLGLTRRDICMFAFQLAFQNNIPKI